MLKPDFTSRYRRDEKRLSKRYVDLAPLVEVLRLVLEDTEESARAEEATQRT